MTLGDSLLQELSSAPDMILKKKLHGKSKVEQVLIKLIHDKNLVTSEEIILAIEESKIPELKQAKKIPGLQKMMKHILEKQIKEKRK